MNPEIRFQEVDITKILDKLSPDYFKPNERGGLTYRQWIDTKEKEMVYELPDELFKI